MEALNDIGASEFLGVRTLTVSIYTTWVTRSDLAGAAQIALAMLLLVVAVVVAEQRARRHRRYANDAQGPQPLRPHRLRGARAAAACALARAAGDDRLPRPGGIPRRGQRLAVAVCRAVAGDPDPRR